MAYNHYNKNLKLIARKLRAQATRAEKIVWYELLSGQRFFGYKFLRQRPISDFVVDFFCSELRLIIEIDGKSHEYDDIVAKDNVREGKLKELGYEIIRFSDWEVKNNLPEVQVLLVQKIQEIEVAGKHN